MGGRLRPGCRPGFRNDDAGSALTAEASRLILDGGRRFCVLYTDATNPVSNAIYPRIGYRHLVDLVDVDFS